MRFAKPLPFGLICSSLAAFVLAVACNAPFVSTPSPTPLVVTTRLTALTAGPVAIEDGCLRVGAHALAFPPEFTVILDFDPNRPQHERIRLVQVNTDD